MKITIDKDKCIASGACVIASARYFAQDEVGMVVVLDDAPPPEDAEEVHEAQLACPAMVIEVTE